MTSPISGPMATLIVGVITISVTGIGALTYSPLRSDIDQLQRDVHALDRRTTALEAIRLDEKLARVEERINNLHIYILQVLPAPRPPSVFRKGDVPLIGDEAKRGG